MPRLAPLARTLAFALVLAPVAVMPLPAAAASYNCDLTTLAPDERAICLYRDLNDMDVEMAVMYRMLTGLFAMGMRGAIQDQQHAWLQSRRTCGADTACLRDHYRRRIGELQAIYDGIDRPI